MSFTEVIFRRWEWGIEKTTRTTLHTETNQVFTAFAPRWIPTCWSKAWLARSFSNSLSLPRPVQCLFWSYSLSWLQRLLIKTLLIKQWVATTHRWVGRISTTDSGIQEDEVQRQDAPWVLNDIMELKTHNCLVLFLFFFFFFFNSWSIWKLLVPSITSYF
jgi:hypothetical protein